jgi:broad specificity phosphatase PhoE
MTTFLLVRHAHVDAVGNSLAGRRDGVHLSEQGRREAAELARWLAGERIDRIYSSPLERARETAAELADGRTLRVEPTAQWTEFDFGEWTGRSFAELDGDPRWRRQGAAMFDDFVRYTRTDGGYAALRSVVTKEKADRMESFVLAETFKYFWLLFAPQDAINLDEVVLNTEAHPLKRVPATP